MTEMTGTDPRYPIGPFTSPQSVDASQRAAYLETLAGLPAQLRAATGGVTGDVWNRPYREGGWTIRQVIHHVADSHMNASVRFRLALTEDSPQIKPYRENLWAELPDATTEPAEVSLQLLDALHRRWVKLLRHMTDAQYARTYRHPEMGEMRLDTVLALYDWHSRHHLAHVHQALAEK